MSPAAGPLDGTPVDPPDAAAARACRDRLDGLAKPLGSLGRLEDTAAWWWSVRPASAAGGRSAHRPASPPGGTSGPASPALAVFASDHAVAARGVSAYPADVTAAMVRQFLGGRAAAGVLAAVNGVVLRVLDVGVDTDWPVGALPPEVTAGKVTRGAAAIDAADAVPVHQARQVTAAGAALADELVDRGHDLLLTGDMGIGNTTAAAAVVAALTGEPPERVVGRGTGIDDDALARKRAVVAAALARSTAPATSPPFAVGACEAARRVGGPDILAMAAFCARAAARRTPVLLDGVLSGAAALVAQAGAPGASAWFAAGHRSAEPAHGLALERLGLDPLLDLRLRLGEGTGALLALPLIRAAAALVDDMAGLAEVTGGPTAPVEA